MKVTLSWQVDGVIANNTLLQSKRIHELIQGLFNQTLSIVKYHTDNDCIYSVRTILFVTNEICQDTSMALFELKNNGAVPALKFLLHRNIMLHQTIPFSVVEMLMLVFKSEITLHSTSKYQTECMQQETVLIAEGLVKLFAYKMVTGHYDQFKEFMLQAKNIPESLHS